MTKITITLTQDQARTVVWALDKALWYFKRTPRANTAEYAYLTRLSDKLQKQAGLKITKVS